MSTVHVLAATCVVAIVASVLAAPAASWANGPAATQSPPPTAGPKLTRQASPDAPSTDPSVTPTTGLVPVAPGTPPPGAIEVSPGQYRVPGPLDSTGCQQYSAWSATGAVLMVMYYRSKDGGFTSDRTQADCRPIARD